MDILNQNILFEIEKGMKLARKQDRDLKLLGVAWNYRYSDMVSNTHSCPRNGETNWGGRKENAPRGYPGYLGRLWVRYNKSPKMSGSGPFEFRECGVNIGTGGAGGYDGPWECVGTAQYKIDIAKKKNRRFRDLHLYSWGSEVFLDDLTDLTKEFIDTWRIERALMNESTSLPDLRFEWTDPETEEKDLVLLQEYKDLQKLVA